jgi:sirohydrochlorin ferrochelatase
MASEISTRLDPRLFAAELAYLEMASPTIEEGVRRLAQRKIERLVVVPLLLFSAGHAKEDIPAAVRSALAAAGGTPLPIVQTDPLGIQEPVIELAAERFREAADSQIPLAETCLLLIGRGSRDEEATAEMQKLGSLLQQRLGTGGLQDGFMAMAQPTAKATILAAAKSSFRQIVVQPHLLFHGDLLDRLQLEVSAAKTSSDKIWRTSRVLGAEANPLSHVLLQAIQTVPYITSL